MSHSSERPPSWHGTTILSVRKGGHVVIAGDGQVSLGATVIKANARKVRKVGSESILVGFAGATADAFTLFERFEKKLETHSGNLTRAAVELAKDWRTDKYLRKLEAMILAADAETILLITGTGDVIEPDDGMAAIGSGGSYALAAARALKRHTPMSAKDIALAAMKIAAELCVFTNENITLETKEREAKQ